MNFQTTVNGEFVIIMSVFSPSVRAVALQKLALPNSRGGLEVCGDTEMMKNKLFYTERSKEAAEPHFQISSDCYPRLNGAPPKTIAVIPSKLPAF